MASNPYLNNFNATNEQDLIENLVVEAIKFYAHDVFYIPRSGINRDEIFNENEYSSFGSNYAIEVYIKNTNFYAGDGEFLSKMGLEIRNQMMFDMSIRSFNELVANNDDITFNRPREGDLLYIPMLKAMYEIKFVETAEVFYQLGKLQSYSITTELFEYSNEPFETGLSGVDNHYNDYSTIDDIDNDPFNQNEEIQEEANNVMDWTESSPFGSDF